jgi:hypothetical protein
MARKKPKYPRTLKYLRQYKAEVVAEMKKNLEKVNASGKLSDSIKASRTSIVDDNINWYIEMEDYAKFVDQGVKGADPNGIYKNNDQKQGVQRAPNSPYSYKTKMPPPSALDQWGVRRGIAPRDSKGRFVPRRSLNFAMAKSIFHQGLKPTYFLTKTYSKYLTPEFETELMLNYSRDIEDQFK